ncbi:MAG: cytidylate kinase [Spirochaetaceae bacterium]|nr:MAG: cytidylate kinase [Spirochaetaceae bacterium]
MKIAISGKSGCGNSTVSRLVADRLGYRLVNFTFKNIAAERGTTFEQICDLAEQDPALDRELDRRQVEMARAGDTVLGSRLAVWVLDDADLRVYLHAPPEVRAARIRQRHVETGVGSTDAAVVLADTIERDRRDHDRYLRIYGIDNDRYDFVDLVIETEHLSPEQIADRIVAAARLRDG